jgi:hypothetical protein
MTDDHGPDCACRQCADSDRLPPSFEDFAVGLIVLLLVGLFLASVFGIVTAYAATENPPCSSAIPQPPLVVVLPDGAEVPATSIEYDLASRRIVVIGNSRVFCDGIEG